MAARKGAAAEIKKLSGSEAAWNYRFKARIGKQAQIRQQELSEPIRRMAWTAQLRLAQRFAALNARGLQANKAASSPLSSPFNHRP